MKKKQSTEAQIAFALRQAESGTPVSDIKCQCDMMIIVTP